MQNMAYDIGAPCAFQKDLNARSTFSVMQLQIGLEVVWKKKET